MFFNFPHFQDRVARRLETLCTPGDTRETERPHAPCHDMLPPAPAVHSTHVRPMHGARGGELQLCQLRASRLPRPSQLAQSPRSRTTYPRSTSRAMSCPSLNSPSWYWTNSVTTQIQTQGRAFGTSSINGYCSNTGSGFSTNYGAPRNGVTKGPISKSTDQNHW